MIKKKCFLQNEYIFKKDLYFIRDANIFCIKKYCSYETFFYIFNYVFLCKKVFYSKTFFPYKNIFSANNVYFVKNTYIHIYIFNIFFNLVLQQMNNHNQTHVPKLLLFLILETVSVIIVLIGCKNMTIIFSKSVGDFSLVQIVSYCIGKNILRDALSGNVRLFVAIHKVEEWSKIGS